MTTPNSSRLRPLGTVAVAAAVGAITLGFAQPTVSTQPATNPVSPKTPQPVFTPQFVTGYEPDEVAVTGTDTIDWMVFDNTSTHAGATPWAMSIFYETPGTAADRWARIIEDPTDPENKVLAYWLKNAVIDSGFQTHTKGRIQTGFPGDLVDATEVWACQRIYLHEDFNLLLDYPPDGDPWWIGIVLEELWVGAAWEGDEYPTRIGLTMYPQAGAMHLQLVSHSGTDNQVFWQRTSPGFDLPVGS